MSIIDNLTDAQLIQAREAVQMAHKTSVKLLKGLDEGEIKEISRSRFIAYVTAVTLTLEVADDALQGKPTIETIIKKN